MSCILTTVILPTCASHCILLKKNVVSLSSVKVVIYEISEKILSLEIGKSYFSFLFILVSH